MIVPDLGLKDARGPSTPPLGVGGTNIDAFITRKPFILDPIIVLWANINIVIKNTQKKFQGHMTSSDDVVPIF